MSSNDTRLLSKYIKGAKAGSGAYGEVFKIENRKTHRIYAAKISLRTISNDGENSDMSKLQRQVDMISKIKHPLIIKFVEFSPVDFNNDPKPAIITEYVPNGSLYDILKLEKSCNSDNRWTKTGKLICIYGIASGMTFLHSHDIIHRDLKPGNILMNKFLFPIICDFGFSKEIGQKGRNSTKSIMGTKEYISPEIWKDQKYTFACDVYAFGFIVYEIFTGFEPWKNFSETEISSKVRRGARPRIPHDVNSSIKKLITNCWKQNPEERPSFSDILNSLRNDDGFIDQTIEEDEYKNFIDFVDNCPTSYNGKSVKMNRYIKKNSEKLEHISLVIKPRAATMKIRYEKIAEIKVKNKKKRIAKVVKKKKVNKNEKNKEKKLIFPRSEYNKLSDECKALVHYAENQPDEQFSIGQYLVEGIKGFNKNLEIGISYLNSSINAGCSDAAIYYARILIEGKLIDRNLELASSLLENVKEKTGNVILLKGLIKKKNEKMFDAYEMFEEASKLGNAESMYQLGKMLFKGIGCEQNKIRAKKLLEQSKNNGFEKSEKFLKENFDLSPKKKKKTLKKKRSKSKSIKKKKSSTTTTLNKESSSKKVIEEKSDHDTKNISIDLTIDDSTEPEKKDSTSIKLDSDTDKKSKSKSVIKKFSYSKNSITSNSSKISLIKEDNTYSDSSEKNKSTKKDSYLVKSDSLSSIKEDSSSSDKDKSTQKYPITLTLITDNHMNSYNSYKTDSTKKDDIYVSNSNNYSDYDYDDDELDDNYSSLARIYRREGNNGKIESLVYYADMLYEGDGIVPNKKKASIYYKKAADKGSIDAMIKYADMNYKGEYININKKEAARYYKMAADEGNVKAMNKYATMLYEGDGIKMDKYDAADYYKKAADESDAESIVKYANMLYYGDTILMDKKEAAFYYEKISYTNMDAMYMYGNMLYKGEGSLKQDKWRASYKYRSAAKEGHAGAMYSYAKMLYKGDGITKNERKAYHYYKMAAEKGNSDAIFDLGQYFSEWDSN